MATLRVPEQRPREEVLARFGFAVLRRCGDYRSDALPCSSPLEHVDVRPKERWLFEARTNGRNEPGERLEISGLELVLDPLCRQFLLELLQVLDPADQL